MLENSSYANKNLLMNGKESLNLGNNLLLIFVLLLDFFSIAVIIIIMSYIIKQKIGNHIYAYEAESYYDKEKKQPRQRKNILEG